MKNRLLTIYHRLLNAYGGQSWWPGESPFEVIVGAILAQKVAWSNAEKAIVALRESGLLTPAQLAQTPLEEIAALIRPCLYYNEKAKKLKAFLRFLKERYSYNLCALFSVDMPYLRQELLSVWGIGEETADAIILYAAKKPSFVVDTYARRILSRVGMIDEKASYADIRNWVMNSLPDNVALFNEYHALLVRHGKERCRSRNPVCRGCPLFASCAASAGVIPP